MAYDQRCPSAAAIHVTLGFGQILAVRAAREKQDGRGMETRAMHDQATEIPAENIVDAPAPSDPGISNDVDQRTVQATGCIDCERKSVGDCTTASLGGHL